MVTGVAPGSASMTAHDPDQEPGYTASYCGVDVFCPAYTTSVSAYASGTVPAQIPTNSRIVNDYGTPGPAVCPNGQAGWLRGVNKVVTDQQNPPQDIVAGGQQLSETITITSDPLGVGKNIITGSTTTTARGIFTDLYFICSAKCPASAATDGATQIITDVYLGATHSLLPVSLAYKCTSITVTWPMNFRRYALEAKVMGVKVVVSRIGIALIGVVISVGLTHATSTTTETTLKIVGSKAGPAIEQIIKIARDNRVPLGVVLANDVPCRLPLFKEAMDDTQVSVADLSALVARNVHGYRLRLTDGVVIFEPSDINRDASQDELLRLPIDDFHPIATTMKGIGDFLWVYVNAAVDVSRGSVGAISINPDGPQVSGLVLPQHSTVETILNTVVTHEPKGAWLLRPLPARWREKVDTIPIEIDSYYGSGASLYKCPQ